MKGWPTCAVVSVGFSVVTPCCQKLFALLGAAELQCCWRSGKKELEARLAGPPGFIQAHREREREKLL